MLQVAIKGKVLDFSDFQEIREGFGAKAKVVQCHGVFDLLHVGHIKHFQSVKIQDEIVSVQSIGGRIFYTRNITFSSPSTLSQFFSPGIMGDKSFIEKTTLVKHISHLLK